MSKPHAAALAGGKVIHADAEIDEYGDCEVDLPLDPQYSRWAFGVQILDAEGEQLVADQGTIDFTLASPIFPNHFEDDEDFVQVDLTEPAGNRVTSVLTMRGTLRATVAGVDVTSGEATTVRLVAVSLGL